MKYSVYQNFFLNGGELSSLSDNSDAVKQQLRRGENTNYLSIPLARFLIYLLLLLGFCRLPVCQITSGETEEHLLHTHSSYLWFPDLLFSFSPRWTTTTLIYFFPTHSIQQLRPEKSCGRLNSLVATNTNRLLLR